MIVETYSLHRQGVVALVAAAVAVMGFFVLFSSGLVNDLEEQERQRMELWAEATRRLAADSQGADDGVDFMLSVIEANRSIPVMLVDSTVISICPTVRTVWAMARPTGLFLRSGWRICAAGGGSYRWLWLLASSSIYIMRIRGCCGGSITILIFRYY